MSESEPIEEKEKQKSKSKLGALLSNNQEMNNSQVCVYYSQNDWKTSEIVEIIVEPKTTVLQLIDSVLLKLKTEFYYDDIDDNNYNLMILKKKTKKPNYDYPICNPESLVLDYAKSNFCLVEKAKPKDVNENVNKENDINVVNNAPNIEKKIEEKNEKKNLENNEIKKEEEKKDQNQSNNNKDKDNKKKKKVDRGCSKGCILY